MTTRAIGIKERDYHRLLRIASAAEIAVEAIERGSSTAPVLECLKAALAPADGEKADDNGGA